MAEILKYINEDIMRKYSVMDLRNNKIAVVTSTWQEYIDMLHLIKNGCKELGLTYPATILHQDVENREDRLKLCAVLLDNDDEDYDVFIGYCPKHICEEDGYLIISPGDIEV